MQKFNFSVCCPKREENITVSIENLKGKKIFPAKELSKEFKKGWIFEEFPLITGRNRYIVVLEIEQVGFSFFYLGEARSGLFEIPIYPPGTGPLKKRNLVQKGVLKVNLKFPPVDPFHSRKICFTVYEIFKTVINSILLFPLRVILFILFFFLAFIFFFFGTIFVKDFTKPFGKFRRNYLKINKIFARIIMLVFGYFWIKEKHMRSPPESYKYHTDPNVHAKIYVSNHVSFIDVFYYLAKVFPCPVAKVEVNKVPVLGRFIKGLQSVLVDRKEKNSRHYVLDEIKRRAIEGGYNPVLIFPEGTCTAQNCIIKFKHGAFCAGQPVQPLVLRYPFSHYDMSWTWQSPLKMMFRMMTQFVNHMEVIYMPVYIPSEEEKLDPNIYAENVQKAMAAVMGVPSTRHSYDDFYLRKYFIKAKVPQTVEFVELQKLGFASNDIKMLLKRFSKIDTNKSSTLDFLELTSSMKWISSVEGYENIDLSVYLKNVFRAVLNRKEKEDFDFYDFCEVISPLRNHHENISTKMQHEIAFKIIDMDDDGKLKWSSINTLVENTPDRHEFLPDLLNRIDKVKDLEMEKNQFNEIDSEMLRLIFQYFISCVLAVDVEVPEIEPKETKLGGSCQFDQEAYVGSCRVIDEEKGETETINQ